LRSGAPCGKVNVMRVKLCLIAGIIAIAAVSGVLESLTTSRQAERKEKDAAAAEKSGLRGDAEAS
jgi:hypothetical protein